jgi:hypothetical protein
MAIHKAYAINLFCPEGPRFARQSEGRIVLFVNENRSAPLLRMVEPYDRREETADSKRSQRHGRPKPLGSFGISQPTKTTRPASDDSGV